METCPFHLTRSFHLVACLKEKTNDSENPPSEFPWNRRMCAPEGILGIISPPPTPSEKEPFAQSSFCELVESRGAPGFTQRLSLEITWPRFKSVFKVLSSLPWPLCTV